MRCKTDSLIAGAILFLLAPLGPPPAVPEQDSVLAIGSDSQDRCNSSCLFTCCQLSPSVPLLSGSRLRSQFEKLQVQDESGVIMIEWSRCVASSCLRCWSKNLLAWACGNYKASDIYFVIKKWTLGVIASRVHCQPCRELFWAYDSLISSPIGATVSDFLKTIRFQERLHIFNYILLTINARKFDVNWSITHSMSVRRLPVRLCETPYLTKDEIERDRTRQ